MLLRLLLAVVAVSAVALAYAGWRRPPRRLGRANLAGVGVTEPAIVHFTAPWCAPCRAAEPALRAAAERAAVPFVQIDLDQRPEVAGAVGVRRLPTVAVTDARGGVVGVWTEITGEIAETAHRARSEALR